MKKSIAYVGAGVLLAATVGILSAFTQKPAGPASPSASWMRQWGMVVSAPAQSSVAQASLTPAVSTTAAEHAAHVAFPNLPTTRSMTAELTVFRNTHVISLQKAQLVWLVTWDETTYAPVPRGGTGPIYTHMNAVVSALTGKILEIFPSP